MVGNSKTCAGMTKAHFRRAISIRMTRNAKLSHTIPDKTVGPPELTTVTQPLGANQVNTADYKPSHYRSITTTIINELFIYLLKWANQGRPSNHAWSLVWQKALVKAFPAHFKYKLYMELGHGIIPMLHMLVVSK